MKQTTVKGEQKSINASMRWLYKEGDTSIDGFEFKKMKTEINQRVAFSEASFGGTTVTRDFKNTKASKEILNLVDEILEVCNEKSKV